ncbi:hypothetical protein BT69DRAFT_1342856 [Atractiella rhizophila]|nr:hypothetical protein BT69DRAFT_1342856 [Atractiella rhizophila]
MEFYYGQKREMKFCAEGKEEKVSEVENETVEEEVAASGGRELGEEGAAAGAECEEEYDVGLALFKLVKEAQEAEHERVGEGAWESRGVPFEHEEEVEVQEEGLAGGAFQEYGGVEKDVVELDAAEQEGEGGVVARAAVEEARNTLKEGKTEGRKTADQQLVGFPQRKEFDPIAEESVNEVKEPQPVEAEETKPFAPVKEELATKIKNESLSKLPTLP